MKMLRHTGLIATAVLLTAGLAGCEQEGPMERAGEELDQSIEQARERMSDAIDTQGPLEQAGENVDQAIEEFGEQTSETLRKAGEDFERATSS